MLSQVYTYMININVREFLRLLTGLSSERVRWIKTIKDLDVDIVNIIGDILLSACKLVKRYLLIYICVVCLLIYVHIFLFLYLFWNKLIPRTLLLRSWNHKILLQVKLKSFDFLIKELQIKKCPHMVIWFNLYKMTG